MTDTYVGPFAYLAVLQWQPFLTEIGLRTFIHDLTQIFKL